MAETPAFSHDAFISYSRKDTPFAAALERALKRYRPPKGLAAPQRRLNVFRDQGGLHGRRVQRRGRSTSPRFSQADHRLLPACATEPLCER